MIEQTLFTILSTAPAITTLCGARIYPLVLPTGPTLPAITYKLIADIPDPSLETSTGLTRSRFQLEAVGATYNDAVNLRKAITDTLLNSSLSFGGIQNIKQINKTDYFDHEALQYMAMIEVYIWH